MESYNLEAVKKNIFHELNKMLVSLLKEHDFAKERYLFHTGANTSDMVLYYLQYPLCIRQLMAEKLGMSERNLNRYYEQPLKILEDFRAMMGLSAHLSYSYVHLVDMFFKNSLSKDKPSSFKNAEESIILSELLSFEKERSIEERRDIARVLHLIMTVNIKVSDFVVVNLKMINKRCYNSSKWNRVLTFLENI